MSNLDFNFSGQCYLVTGASSGIGRELCLQLSKAGARVVLVGRNVERLNECCGELLGSDHVVSPCNLDDIESLEGWVIGQAKAVEGFNGFVHCAGIMEAKPLRGHSSSDWDLAWRTNVASSAMIIKGLRRKKLHRESASFVLLSSVMGQVGQAGQVLYSATKGALISMARSLALELVRDGIRVNCVAPGAVQAGMTKELERTLPAVQMDAVKRMHPLGLGESVDVCNAIQFLLSPESKWITGTTMVIDGGYTVH